MELISLNEKKNKRVLNIFKVKYDGHYKTELLLRGCQQKEGLDYEGTVKLYKYDHTVIYADDRMLLGKN